MRIMPGYKVDVNYTDAPSCFFDMEIQVNFTGQLVSIDIPATDATTGSDYSAVAVGTQNVKFTGSPSSFSSGLLGTFYFDIDGGTLRIDGLGSLPRGTYYYRFSTDRHEQLSIGSVIKQ